MKITVQKLAENFMFELDRRTIEDIKLLTKENQHE